MDLVGSGCATLGHLFNVFGSERPIRCNLYREELPVGAINREILEVLLDLALQRPDVFDVASV